jgi:cytidylate kinase
VVIAIDGPAGSGKSTLGRGLAVALEMPYVNTGLMYRAVTARALERGAGLDDAAALAAIAGELEFDLDQTTRPPELRIDGAAPGQDLVRPEVEAAVSRVSRHPEVRSILADAQRRLGVGGAVMEGRDIGTVIFPDADVKLFLRADEDVRASRRMAERESAAPELAQSLRRRDELDARTNPPVPAEDAVVLDTQGRGPEAVLAHALSVVSSRVNR